MSSSGRGVGRLFVVSAPSGTGKTTVVEHLVRQERRLERSRSYTSRAVRNGEKNGVDYNFISRTAFLEMVERDEFLEWAEVVGHFYGTGRRDTEQRLAQGSDLVLVIDVQGGRQIRRRVPGSVGIFLLPPSRTVLEQRLRARSREAEPELLRRLEIAATEVGAVNEYDYVVVNDVLETCVAQVAAIVAAERARLNRQPDNIERILATFRR